MKTAAIIAEYNPFHNGHKYHIEQTRQLTGADYIIVIMSGSFVQRGEPALLDKGTRTRMALLNGADLVIELPTVFAVGSAGDFASGAVSLLDKLGVVNFLSFGSECGDVDWLQKAAQLLLNEPAEFSADLKYYLKQGWSYPKARAAALTKALSVGGSDFSPETLASPNNILGVEYCMALLKRNSKTAPFTVKRCGAGYHDSSIPEFCAKQGHFASATAIRTALMRSAKTAEPQSDSLFRAVPENTLPLWKEILSEQLFLFPEDFTKELRYALLMHQDRNLQHFADIHRELADKISCIGIRFTDWANLCELCKSKEITYTKISRALCHILLDITQEELTWARQNDYASYARILGFRRSAAPLLSAIGKNTEIPLISKLADAERFLSGSKLHMLKSDIRASHVYESALSAKTGSFPLNEYTRQICIL
ncbi:MAG: nucleotidyltransferase [Lachnospiraceae bacterium]|nr:nucleotidyltransferase [Lachnospiraceae bacterium]